MRPYRHVWPPAEPHDVRKQLVAFQRGRPPIDLAFEAMIGPVAIRLGVQARA